MPQKKYNGEHKPRFQYDCENCKFSWCCGYTCCCHVTGPDGKVLPDPPRRRQDAVDRALVQIGYAPQFRGKNAERR